MDQLSFFKYHNRHIRFEYEGQQLQGVVVDSIPYDEKQYSTEYAFIPTNRMRAWKDAEDERDEQAMRNLERRIDLRLVKNPELLNH